MRGRVEKSVLARLGSVRTVELVPADSSTKAAVRATWIKSGGKFELRFVPSGSYAIHVGAGITNAP